MKVLITGVSGLIGGRIAVVCRKRGWNVSGIDIKDTEDGDIDFHKGSIMDIQLLRKAMRDCDFVFHEAAASSSPMFHPDPAPGIGINVEGSMNVFSTALHENVSKVVAASTSSIYGNLPLPSKEEQLIESTPNMYAASKLSMEALGSSYSTVTGLPVVFLRYFSVYGLGERKKGKIANMLSQFLWDALELDGKGRKPVIFGDGKQTRDLIFADDIAEANVQAALSSAKSGVFNVGTGRETSLNELIAMISGVIGREIKADYVENPINNYIYRTLADTSKCRKTIGFASTVSVTDGIKSIVKELTGGAHGKTGT